jgi:hypothetical protein
VKLLNKYYWLFFVLSFLYLLAPFVNTPDPAVLARLNITPESALLINLSSAVPFILMWFLSFYAFVKLRDYAKRIREDDDGKGFELIARGFGVTAIGIPLIFVITRWMLNATNVDLIPEATQVITGTYLILIVPILSFALSTAGALKLYRTVEFPIIHPWRWVVTALACINVGVFYTYAVFANPSRNFPQAEGVFSYFMSDLQILTTVVIPYISLITLASVASVVLSTYYTSVSGILYKLALKKISIGFIFCISGLSLSQFVNAIGNVTQTHGFAFTLMLSYLMLGILVAGSFLIASGAKHLNKIEEASDA